jgi:hypothetical protein
VYEHICDDKIKVKPNCHRCHEIVATKPLKWLLLCIFGKILWVFGLISDKKTKLQLVPLVSYNKKNKPIATMYISIFVMIKWLRLLIWCDCNCWFGVIASIMCWTIHVAASQPTHTGSWQTITSALVGSEEVRRCGSHPYCEAACRPIVAAARPRGAPVAALVGELVVLPTRSRTHHRPTRGRPPATLRRHCFLGIGTQKQLVSANKSVEKMDRDGKKKQSAMRW